MTPKSNESTADREITISREFAAPRALAWEAMTNPQHVVNWWGPRGFTSVIVEHDFRAGGKWEHTMTGPDGTKYPNFATFKEIVPQERVVFVNGGKREGGPGVTFTATWSFEELAPRKTRVTMKLVFPSAEMRDFVVKEFGAVEGGKQNLEKMGEFLAEQQCPAFTMEREFAAPRELVWQAWTEREHLMKWFGPKGCTISVANLDFRVGGSFHYCMAMPGGHEMWGLWIFRQIVPPEKIVLANSFSDKDGNLQRPPFPGDWSLQMLTVTTFTEKEGKTTISLKWFPLDASEAEIKHFTQMRGSFKQGWTGTFDQLTEYLAQAKS